MEESRIPLLLHVAVKSPNREILFACLEDRHEDGVSRRFVSGVSKLMTKSPISFDSPYFLLFDLNVCLAA